MLKKFLAEPAEARAKIGDMFHVCDQCLFVKIDTETHI